MQGVQIKRLKDGLFTDPKTGWSAYPFMRGFGGGAEADLRGVHVVCIMPGQTRGNHYHRDTNELLYIFHGKGSFRWKDIDGLHDYAVVPGHTLITIPAGISHAFTNTGEAPVLLLALRDGMFDPAKPDVVPSVLA